jgi:hypothetical protein
MRHQTAACVLPVGMTDDRLEQTVLVERARSQPLLP